MMQWLDIEVVHFRRRLDFEGRLIDTLADIPPKKGGVLVVGINPSPVSVRAGHYYQGRLGRRLWTRLERLGLLRDFASGAEDEAFSKAGHGLTDLVKRPTPSASELSTDELRDGVEALRTKVRKWQPGLVIFPFALTARTAVGPIRPGVGPALEGIPTFLLTGPYASRAETTLNDGELRRLLEKRRPRPAPRASPKPDPPRLRPRDSSGPVGDRPDARSQRVTAADLTAGRIRLPRSAKSFFPTERATIELVIRGRSLQARYDPRLGPDRERSGVLSIGREALRKLVDENEVLRITAGSAGEPRLE